MSAEHSFAWTPGQYTPGKTERNYDHYPQYVNLKGLDGGGLRVTVRGPERWTNDERPLLVMGHTVSIDLPPEVAREAIAAWNTRSEAASALEETAWRPIETAPKDGTRVLVWSERYQAAVTAELNGTIWAVHGWALNHQPTHWQPLPSPPAALDRSDLGEG